MEKIENLDLPSFSDRVQAEKAERGDRSAVCPAQIVWRGAFDAKLGAGRSHGVGGLLHASEHRSGLWHLGEQGLRCSRYPHAVVMAVLSSKPVQCWNRFPRHLPPAVYDVLAPHVRDLARTLAGEQDHLERGAC